MENEDDYDQEDVKFDDCQRCGKPFEDDICKEFQVCSYCLWDSEEKKYTQGTRKPQWDQF